MRSISKLTMMKIDSSLNSSLNRDRFHNKIVRELKTSQEKDNKFFQVILFWKRIGVKQKHQVKTSKYCCRNNIVSSNCGNDIIVSSSGQKKIDNFASCLSLVNSDFIIF